MQATPLPVPKIKPQTRRRTLASKAVPLPSDLRDSLAKSPEQASDTHACLTSKASYRYNQIVELNKNREEMTPDQLQIYNFAFCQVRLITTFPNYLRQHEDFSFIRMVGKGGFGHVWVANDMKTGKVVAIKELHKIDGKKETPVLKFVREVQTMIRVKSRFVLPIYGFTAELPFSIIMPYKNGQTLNDLLRTTEISPTQLSIFAICIAQGLKDIHDANVIYRDVKASNILMDDDGLPIICDFGTAKVYQPGRRMSLNSGTFSFMAPEVIQTYTYDQRCDIYSYGMLIYEMSELKVPFRKMTDEQRIEKILKGERPPFIKDRTPRDLRTLITRCWDPDPEKRPTWEGIIDLFATGQVSFNGSNNKKVREFYLKMKDEVANFEPLLPPPLSPQAQEQLLNDVQESLFKNELFKNTIGQDKINNLIVFERPTLRNHTEETLETVPEVHHVQFQAAHSYPGLSYMDSNDQNNDLGQGIIKVTATDTELNGNKEETLDTEEEEEEEDNNDNPDEDAKSKAKSPAKKGKQMTPRQILHHPELPEFKRYLHFLSLQLTPRQFFDFYQSTLMFIRGHWKCPQIEDVFECYTNLAKRNQEFLDIFSGYNVFHAITSSTLKYSMGLMAQLVHHRPKLIHDCELKILISFLSSDPYEAIYLFGEISNQLNLVQKPLALFDTLMHKYETFLGHETGEIFLGIFYSLLTRWKGYHAKRIDELRPIFVKFLESSESIHKDTAINVICQVYDNQFEISIDNLMNHYSQSNNQKGCVSLLLRLNNYPVSSAFAHKIIDMIPNHPLAFFILMQYASEGIEQSKFLVEYPKWMNEYVISDSQQIHQQLVMRSFQLFMVLSLKEEIRGLFISMPEFQLLIKNIFQFESRSVFVALNAALKKMNIDHSFIKQIADTGILDSFLDAIKNPKMCAICLMTLQTIVSKGICESYLKFVPLSVSILQEEQYDIISKKAVLQLLATMGPFENASKAIKSCEELMNFVTNDHNPNLEKYRTALMKIVQRYST